MSRSHVRETASKTDVTTLSWPDSASSAPWSSTPSLQRSISFGTLRAAIDDEGCCFFVAVRQVKGVDEFSDLAVVQVALQRGDTLPGTPLGDSDEMQVL